MEAWTLSLTVGELLIDFSILGGLLLAGTLLRHHVGFFQKYLVPNSLIAGFLGLLLGAELAGWLPIDIDRMGAYVYHLLALTFIGVGLIRTERRQSFGVVNLGLLQILVMVVQAIAGLAIALAAASWLLPDFEPANGLLLPLGFSMGPGIAYSIGQSWQAFGLEGSGSLGLTVAALGFLAAYFWGMVLVNRTSGRDGRTLNDAMRRGVIPSDQRKVGSMLSFSGAAIEPLAVHLALIGGVYLITWMVTGALVDGLVMLGMEQEIPVIWSFHFIFANIIALLCRRTILAGNRGSWIDDGTVHRITGTFADYLIAASIMGISLTIAWEFALPILFICVTGALFTFWILRRATYWLFRTFRFERFIGMFALTTGTISSGLALLRVTDPEYRTPVAQELVLSSGIALMFGFPLLLVINMPFTVFNGVRFGYLWIILILALYLGVLISGWALYLRKASPESSPVS